MTSTADFPPIEPGASLIVAYQLKLQPVLLVGGGQVAAGRLFALLAADAKVTLISPLSGLHPETHHRLFDPVEKAKWAVNYLDREYEGPQDLEGMVMVMTAIDDPVVSRTIGELARSRSIPVNVADVPPLCDFYFGSIVRRGPLQIMVSTGGKAPRLANRIRRGVEDSLEEEVGEALENMGELRMKLRAKVPGGGKDIGKRMGWMIKVSDAWSVKELAKMDQGMIDKVLEGWENGKAKRYWEVCGGNFVQRFGERVKASLTRCPVRDSPDGKASRCPFVMSSSGLLIGVGLTVGVIKAIERWRR